MLHLLYSRFYTKFLHDIGVVDFDEPFRKLFNQGMILGPKGVKMSKSLGNVVSPDDMIREYGCDSLRMYELFIGPPQQDAAWDDRGMDGVARFLRKFWNTILTQYEGDFPETAKTLKIRNSMVHDITQRLENFSLNTVEGTDVTYAEYVGAHSSEWTNIMTNLGFFWPDSASAVAEPDWDNLDWATLTQKTPEA